MNSETKNCQNCKQEFTIEPEDFDFYEKIKVPPPTWCPECRMVWRMNWKNERSLYIRKCDAPGHSEKIFSLFSPGVKRRIYDRVSKGRLINIYNNGTHIHHLQRYK